MSVSIFCTVGTFAGGGTAPLDLEEFGERVRKEILVVMGLKIRRKVKSSTEEICWFRGGRRVGRLSWVCIC